MIDAAYMAAHFPNLPGVSDTAYVELKIAEAALQISESVWGTLYDLGLANLVAHSMLLQVSAAGATGSGAVAGPITSERVGDLSRSYGSPSGSGGGSATDGGYDQTVYGKEYKRLQRIVLPGPIVLGPML